MTNATKKSKSNRKLPIPPRRAETSARAENAVDFGLNVPGGMSRRQAEFRLCCFVADCLRRFAAPNVVWTHFPAGEARPFKVVKGRRFSMAGERLKRMGTLPGVADYIFITRDGCAFLELKAKDGEQTDDQGRFAFNVMALGWPYAIARTGQEAIEILQSWGILSHRVRAAA